MSCKVLVATFQFRRREHGDCKFEVTQLWINQTLSVSDEVAQFRTFH